MVGDGAGHATERDDVVSQESIKEVSYGFIAYDGLKAFLFILYGHPLMTFEQ